MSTTTDEKGEGLITRTLMELVTNIPRSREQVGANPDKRARRIALVATAKAGSVSGALAVPPGPWGIATIFPDLMAIWRIQQQMVADIAAVYGKTACLKKETMIYCLFKHGGAALLKDIVVRVGQRFIVKRTTLRVVQQVLKKLGIRVTQKLIKSGVARWIPVVGAAGMAAYSSYDTWKIAQTSIELFSKEIEMDT